MRVARGKRDCARSLVKPNGKSVRSVSVFSNPVFHGPTADVAPLWPYEPGLVAQALGEPDANTRRQAVREPTHRTPTLRKPAAHHADTQSGTSAVRPAIE